MHRPSGIPAQAYKGELIKMATSLSCLPVFFLSMWQVGALSKLAIKGWGVRPMSTTAKKLGLLSIVVPFPSILYTEVV